jgi:uncharacterized protein DUF6334
MLDTLAKICDDGGPLVGVSYTLFEGDPQFITAVGLRFESLTAVLRAVPDDDSLEASLGLLAPEPHETLFEATDSGPWPACMGLGICWAWCLTNQQGYSDGVRLEFSEPGVASSAVVEFIVAASAIHVFVAVPGATA